MMNSLLLLFVRWDVHPTLFTFGPVEIRYYGLMWALALGISAYIFSNLIKREGYSDKMFDSIFWYGVLSTIIGARLGHCLFYDPGYYLTHPVEILYIHQGGLASHGAAVGLLVGLWLFSRKNKMPYMWSLDRIAIAVCIAGALVRIGNLMNSEIYGEATSLPWYLPDRAVRLPFFRRIHQESAGRVRTWHVVGYGTVVERPVRDSGRRHPVPGV